MHALWAAPPAILIAGSLAIAAQLRRIAAEGALLVEASRVVESDRAELVRVARAAGRTRASLDGLERR